MSLRFSIIVAMAQNHVIGQRGSLPWRIKEDMQHFKKITLYHPVIMGRKTFQSFSKPLVHRYNIVLTHEPKQAPHVFYVSSLEEALQAAKDYCVQHGVEEFFCIGGQTLYEQTLPLVTRLYMTRILKDFQGDTKFPPLNLVDWTILKQERKKEKELVFEFLTMERK